MQCIRSWIENYANHSHKLGEALLFYMESIPGIPAKGSM